MSRLRLPRLLGFGFLLVCAAGLQPPPVAVSDFVFYSDSNSPAISNCTPTATGCTGECAAPTCGSQATPCHTIQQAINIANCNIGSNTALEADVLVAAGTYPERIYIYPNIHLIGSGRDVTTLDAKGLNRSAVIMAGGGGFGFNRPRVKFSISGFRVIHGSGDRIALTDQGGGTYYNIAGGGMLLYGESTGWPRVTECRIEDNTLGNFTGLEAPDWMGAGIYIAQGRPVISGNIIQRNTSSPPDPGNSTATGWGAGIYSLNFDCHPLITHNVVRNNVTVAYPGAGGGMYINGGAGTVLSNNLVVANSASLGAGWDTYPSSGGGIYVYGVGVSAYNNVVMGNTGADSGGGLSLGAQDLYVHATNNTVVGNVLTLHVTKAPFPTGGGVDASFILSQQGSPLVHLTNNLIAQNDATSRGFGGGLYSYNAFATNDHNDFYGDLGDNGSGVLGPNEIRGDYTDAGVIGSDGNISLNPVFSSAPEFWDHTNAAGTSSTAVVFNSTRYAVGDHVEYNDDGVSRQITAINGTTKTLTFTPALAYKVCSNAVNAACTTSADCLSPGTCNTATTLAKRILANWGSSPEVAEDLRLTGSSPLRDAGTNSPLFGTVPSADFDDLPRPADGDQNGSAITDIGAFEYRVPDGDGDGDGVPDSSDCAPLVNSVWTMPDQVPEPLAISSAQVLSWSRIPQSNVYNVYSGTVTSPFTYAPGCLAAEVPGLSTSVNVGPAPGLGLAFYYLVGGVNACGSGPIHSSSTVYPPAACPPQSWDTDTDGALDINDNCPGLYNPVQEDPEHDTVGSGCDNCPAIYNPDQADADADGHGSACDNCPSVYNPTQLDANTNGIGDHCEDADTDTYPLTVDCDDNNSAIHPGAAEVCNGFDDNCVNGIDEGGSGLCADTNACTQDVCGGISGCQNPPVTDGTACSDGNACTQIDTCQSGVCTGSNPVICTAPDDCHDPGTCNPSTGLCGTAPVKPNGTTCSDGNACTAGDSCQGGVCQAGGLRDADVDAHPDLACGGDDCSDTNPLVWHAPAEAENLVLTGAGPVDLAWDSQAVTAGPETVYDLVSGALSSSAGIGFPSAGCLQSGMASAAYSDARPDPAAGSGFWYLTRARNSCGTGTYGNASRDSDIPPCP